VLEKLLKYFRLAVGSGVEAVSVDRLKTYQGRPPESVAAPLCYGRLPAALQGGHGSPPAGSASPSPSVKAGGSSVEDGEILLSWRPGEIPQRQDGNPPTHCNVKYRKYI
jgi:hypothetical protein